MQGSDIQQFLRHVTALADETTFDAFFQKASELVLDLLAADFACVIIGQPDGMAVYRSCEGLPTQLRESLMAGRVSAAELVAWGAVDSRGPLFVDDYQRHPCRNANFVELGMSAALYVPALLSQVDLRAVVGVGWRRQPEDPSPYKLAVMEVISKLVASFLYRESLEEERDSVVRLNAVLSHVNQAIARHHSPAALFQEVCNIAVDVGEMRLAWIAELEGDRDRVRPAAVSGLGQDYVTSQHITTNPSIPEGHGPIGTAFREGELQIVQAIETDSRMNPWRAAARRWGFGSIGCIPIVADDRPIAVFAVYAGKPNVFGAREQQLLREIGADLSFSIAYMRESYRLRRTRAQLSWEATHDALTGLPNRAFFRDRLRQALIRTDRQRDSMVAVLMVDLDGFKEVNDRIGHAGGDVLLRRIARRFESVLKDFSAVARLGGDEFVLLLEDAQQMSDVDLAVKRVLSTVELPIDLGSEQIEISATIGIAAYPFEEDPAGDSGARADSLQARADSLLARADMAMYKAKRNGHCRYRVFDLGLDREVRERHELRREVAQALEGGNLCLHYQPKVDLFTGEVLGVEALVRLVGPDARIAAPGPYLQAVASTHLLPALDQWVLENVFAQAATWIEVGSPMRVSINISRDYLRQAECVPKLRELIDRYPQTPPLVQLEILESISTEDLAVLGPVLDEIVGLGMELVLDDFGTGASALIHLQQVPAREIKIDQGFVRKLPERPENEAIIQALIAFAERVPRRIVAEGVETIAIGSRLRRLGCRFGQGYAIAKPMPPSALALWLKKWELPEAWRPVAKEFI